MNTDTRYLFKPKTIWTNKSDNIRQIVGYQERIEAFKDYTMMKKYIKWIGLDLWGAEVKEGTCSFDSFARWLRR